MINMSKQKTIILAIVSLVVGIFIGIGINKVLVIKETNENFSSYEKIPRETLIVLINDNQQEEFFNLLNDFSYQEGFAIRIAPTSPNGDSFIIEMWREDIKIIALNNFEKERFSISFYDTDSSSPYILPYWALDALINHFVNFINDIDGIQINKGKND